MLHQSPLRRTDLLLEHVLLHNTLRGARCKVLWPRSRSTDDAFNLRWAECFSFEDPI